MSNVLIPSSEADRKRIKDCIIEISNSMTRIAAEKDFIKEAILNCCDEVEVDKKHLRKMATIYYKQNLAEVVNEVDEIEALYESIVQ